MAATKYRYGTLVIEVEYIKEISSLKRQFRCLVRGFGGRKDIPRKTYMVEAETNAKAARLALDKYDRNIE